MLNKRYRDRNKSFLSMADPNAYPNKAYLNLDLTLGFLRRLCGERREAALVAPYRNDNLTLNSGYSTDT